MALPSPAISPSTSPPDTLRDPSPSSNLGKFNKERDPENADDGVRPEDDGIPVVRLAGANDPLSPLNFSVRFPLSSRISWASRVALYQKAKKYLILALISSCSLCVTSASSMVPFTYEAMREEFEVSEIVATLGLSLFVIGLGWAPRQSLLILSRIMETAGK